MLVRCISSSENKFSKDGQTLYIDPRTTHGQVGEGPSAGSGAAPQCTDRGKAALSGGGRTCYWVIDELKRVSNKAGAEAESARFL